MKNIIKTEIPKAFYPAFSKAIIECGKHHMEIEMDAKYVKSRNLYVIKVKAKDPLSFYHLGKFYATFRNEL